MKKILYTLLIFCASLNILQAQLAIDAAVVGAVYPATFPCGSTTSTVGIIISNLGTTPITSMIIQAQLQVGTLTLPLPIPYNGNLLTNQLDTITLGPFNTTAGATLGLLAYTTLAGDLDNSNDSFAIVAAVILNAQGATVTGNLAVCTGDSTTLTAQAVNTIDPTTTYEWYDAPSGGNLLYTGAAFSTGALSTTTDFYLETKTYDMMGVQGCVRPQTPVTVTVNTLPTITVTADDVDCYNTNTGLVQVTASGAGGYTYLWDNGQTASSFSTGIGTYNVTVTDMNNCIATGSTTVSQPDSLTATAIATDITCFGANDGFITITTMGGTAPYTSSGGGTGLGVGGYIITIFDANNCMVTTMASVSEPTALAINIASTPDTSGTGVGLGTATVTATGGTPDYTYNWGANANNQTTSTATGLIAGTYIVTVTDANNCSDTISTIVADVTNTNDLSLIASLEIMPNPAQAQATIVMNLEEQATVQLEVYNSVGQLVKDYGVQKTAQINQSLEVNQLNSGIYWIRIRVNQALITRKLVVIQ